MNKITNYKLSSPRHIILDIIKTICILLMITDHFFFFAIKFQNAIWLNQSNIIKEFILKIASSLFDGELVTFRIAIRSCVLFCFFYIAGIGCSLSQNNNKRFMRLAILAIGITMATLLISTVTELNIFISWGVISCYAACLFIYILINKKCKDTSSLFTFCIIFLFIGFVITYFNPKVNNTNLWMPLGIPSSSFSYEIEYFPVFKWLGIYFIGVFIGSKYYLLYSKTQELNVDKRNIFMFISKYSARIYILHFPLVLICLKLVDFV